VLHCDGEWLTIPIRLPSRPSECGGGENIIGTLNAANDPTEELPRAIFLGLAVRIENNSVRLRYE
jgi:hypothetical protein